MKNTIRDITIYKAVSSVSQPISDATHDISTISFYILEIELESGIKGQGYLLSFHYSPNSIIGALQDIKRFAIGYEANETVKIKQDYDKETEYFGSFGLQRWAIGVLNVAMWDAWGKTLNSPIWKILGSSVKKVPIYGSGGWLSYTDKELIEEVTDYKRRGFTAVKIKVGSKEYERDIERLKKAREALGKDVKIMMDANQGMDVPTALKLSNEAISIGIHWFEEPIVNNDFAGYEILRQKTAISLAMGEREYDCTALKHLISRNAIDLWQPDLLRMGGVEEWRSSAALATAYNIPVLPHYYKDYDVPLLCSIPNGYGAESFDWIDGIIDNTIRIDNGFAFPREGAGWGFTFKEECLEEIK